MKKNITLTIMLMLIFSLVGCTRASTAKNTAYTGEAEGRHGLIKVEVLVNGKKIEQINILDQNETAGISDPAFDQIPKSIIEKQRLALDAVSGATLTSKGIINAVGAALDKAGVKLEK